MKSFKTIVFLALVAISLNSCLSMKFAEKVIAKDEYPGEYFAEDTFQVTMKNLKDKKTVIRVVNKDTKAEIHKVEIGPFAEVNILVKANEVVLIKKSSNVEYKFELTGE